MTSEILDSVLDTVKQIKYQGESINGTMEINNVVRTFCPEAMNLEEEENAIQDYYNKYVENYYGRLKLEKNHYRFLEAFLIHKVGEVLYFHKSETYTSRKFVIWSQDCIAAIQFISRPGRNLLNVFIRSSDTIRLLPIDYLYMMKLLGKVCDEFNIQRHKQDMVTFFITSAHWYHRDTAIVEEVLNGR